MDHTNHVRLTASELTPTILEDAAIYGPNDEKIGSVSHVHGTGPATEIVIDVGGFLGIGAPNLSLFLPANWTSCVTKTEKCTPSRHGRRISSRTCPNTTTKEAWS